MVTRLRRAIAWARAVRLSRLGYLTKAVEKVRYCESLGPLMYYEEAFLGALLVRDGKVRDGDRILQKVVSTMDRQGGENRAYVKLFCLSCLTIDRLELGKLGREAETLRVDAALRRWLPMPITCR